MGGAAAAPTNFLETSAGQFQAFYLFDQPEAFAAVKPIAARLKAYAACDHGTADLSHVWRIAGTLNWPNAKKVGAGRPFEPQTVRVVRPWQGDGISLADLAAALPGPKAEPSISVGSGEKVEAEPAAESAPRMSRSAPTTDQQQTWRVLTPLIGSARSPWRDRTGRHIWRQRRSGVPGLHARLSHRRDRERSARERRGTRPCCDRRQDP